MLIGNPNNSSQERVPAAEGQDLQPQRDVVFVHPRLDSEGEEPGNK
jgi:hypothetical protein